MSAADADTALWQQHKQAADLAFKNGNYPEAASNYTRVIIALNDDRSSRPAVSDRVKVYANRSLACLKMADFKEALKDAQIAVGLDPRWQKGWYRLASALEGLGMLPEAEIAVDTGLPLDASNTEMQQLLKQVRRKSKGSPPADEQSSEDRQLQQDIHTFFRKHCKNATLLKERGANNNVPSAEDNLNQSMPAKQAGPPTTEQQAESAKDLGNTQYKAGQYDAALLSYGKAIALCPEATKLSSAFARGYQRAGKAYLCMGQLDEADSQYKRALELEPSSVAIKGEAQLVDMIRSNLKLGQECLQAGDARQAQWHADKAVRLHSPAVETALLLKCEALIALGKSAEALNETRSLTIQGDPMATEVLTVRAQALYLTGNMSLAENTYQVVLRLDPDNASSRKGLKRIKLMNNSKNAGNEAFKAGKWREAEQHYTQALELDSHLKSSFVAQCACNRAAAHLKLGNAEAALKDAEVATELDPQYARAYVRRAAAHQALEHFEEAVRDYEKVKSLEESTAGIDGMIRDAKTALKKSKRVDYYKLLELDQNAGDADLKRAYRKAALRYHPDKASSEDRDENEKKFKLVGQANAILSDPAKRQKYDAGWSAEEIDQGMQMGEDGTYGHGGHGANMDDVFAHMFAGGMFGGGGMGGGRGGGGGFSRRGGFPPGF
ncbi:hypothetical protein WJX79_007204 [Trebouxia sp. C0005]